MKTRNNIRIVYLHLLNVIQISSTCRFNNLFPVHCVLHYILYILCNTCSIVRLTSQWVLICIVYIYIWSTAPGDGLKIRDLRSDIGIYLCISFVIESSHNNYQTVSIEVMKVENIIHATVFVCCQRIFMNDLVGLIRDIFIVFIYICCGIWFLLRIIGSFVGNGVNQEELFPLCR